MQAAKQTHLPRERAAQRRMHPTNGNKRPEEAEAKRNERKGTESGPEPGREGSMRANMCTTNKTQYEMNMKMNKIQKRLREMLTLEPSQKHVYEFSSTILFTFSLSLVSCSFFLLIFYSPLSFAFSSAAPRMLWRVSVKLFCSLGSERSGGSERGREEFSAESALPRSGHFFSFFSVTLCDPFVFSCLPLPEQRFGGRITHSHHRAKSSARRNSFEVEHSSPLLQSRRGMFRRMYLLSASYGK